jgi:hypothetical protein
MRTPKARLAATLGAYSTRMGAALRHAGHLLSGRRADKKLLLVLTDGQPADVDVNDPLHLQADAACAVRELDNMGLHTHCISLDAKADDYVGRIFGSALDRDRPCRTIAAPTSGAVLVAHPLRRVRNQRSPLQRSVRISYERKLNQGSA